MPEAGETEGELKPSDLAELFVLQGEDLNYSYPLVLARRRVEEEDSVWIAGAVIGEADSGAVIAAFPGASWNRQVDRRLLPTGAVQYPKSYQVSVVGPESREEKIEDVTIKIWVLPLFVELRAAGDRWLSLLAGTWARVWRTAFPLPLT